MSYAVRLSAPAEKDFARLDSNAQRRIRDRLRQLADNPYEARISKQLQGLQGMRSSRVGPWRVLYSVLKSASLVY